MKIVGVAPTLVTGFLLMSQADAQLSMRLRAEVEGGGLRFIPEFSIQVESPLVPGSMQDPVQRLEWEADLPEGARVEVATRSGDTLEAVTRYFDSRGDEITRKRWDSLPTRMRGDVVEGTAPGPDWSAWSAATTQSGAPFDSPTPRSFYQVRLRLVTRGPEQAIHLRRLRLEAGDGSIEFDGEEFGAWKGVQSFDVEPSGLVWQPRPEPPVVLASDPVELPGPPGSVLWGADLPGAGQLDIRTLTGPGVLLEQHYHTRTGVEVSRSDYEALPEDERGEVVEVRLPDYSWTPDSPFYLFSGQEFFGGSFLQQFWGSPSTHRFVQVQATLGGPGPEGLPRLRWILVSPEPGAPTEAASERLRGVVPEGRIAFASSRTDLGDIFVMSSDGSGAINLTDPVGLEATATPSFSPDGSRVVFAGLRDGNWDLFVVAAGGGLPARLTRDPGDDVEPAWSPDGRRIAFASDRAGTFDIFVMSSDGADPMAIAPGPAKDRAPTWSPGSDRIAYASTGEDFVSHLVIISAEGGPAVRLTDSDQPASRPAWSPDGRRIAFIASDWTGAYTSTGYFAAPGGPVFAVEADGGDPVPIFDEDVAGVTWSPDGRRLLLAETSSGPLLTISADGPAQVEVLGVALGSGFRSVTRDPVWAPDGSRIAVIGSRDGGEHLFLVDPEGANPINLTHPSGLDQAPDWSPDGTRIAFESDRDNRRGPAGFNPASDVFVMGADGSRPTNLTRRPGDDASPDFSPDGTHIAFVSDRDGSFDVFVMADDGSGVLNLTNHSARDYDPAWSPDGSRIAFVSNRDGEPRVYTMAGDGSDARPLGDLAGVSPAWSPEGNRIAFTGPGGELVVARADGTDPVRLTLGSGGPSPTWAGDGTYIAFVSGRDSFTPREVYVMAPGGPPFNITLYRGGWDPDWLWGSASPTAVERREDARPQTFALDPIYPNPFNGATVISFALPQRAEVDLALYDALGQRVATLLRGDRDRGAHRVTWDGRIDGRPVATGSYFCRLRAESYLQVRRLTVLK